MKILTILIFSVILNACGASQTATSLNEAPAMKATDLDGRFVVSTINTMSLAENLTLTFDSKTNKVIGFSGCNSFFGSYSTDGNALTFKNLASTEKYCIETLNLVESKMIAALNATTNFKTDASNITLLNNTDPLLTATKITDNNKMAQDSFSIEYTAITRGVYKKIILENKTISVQNSHSGDPLVKPCKDEDWKTLLQAISELNLKNMSALEAPSKAHQYDGAQAVTFSITKEGNTYQVPTFDAGNPNKEIAPLIELVLNIAETTKEKN